MRRRLRQATWLAYLTTLLVSLSLIIGPLINDHTIGKDPGRALARVTAVTHTRTTIDYQDEAGIYHSPPNGVLYPGNLGPNQLVWVTYAKTNPDIVKIEGRTWHLALLPAGSVAAVATIIFLILMTATKKLHRPRRKSTPAAAPGSAAAPATAKDSGPAPAPTLPAGE